MADHWWAMMIDIEKCIGCGNCVRACKAENDVPLEPFYFRTWVERYHVAGGRSGAPGRRLPERRLRRLPGEVRRRRRRQELLRPEALQPLRALPLHAGLPGRARRSRAPTASVLVDKSYCLGCRYCVQACPYGCRYIDPGRRRSTSALSATTGSRRG